MILKIRENQLYKDSYRLEQRISFRDTWYAYMKRFNTKIEFFEWFEHSRKIDGT